jgi:hypothetical protein
MLEPEKMAATLTWDVVVFRTNDVFERDERFHRDPPLNERVDLGYDIHLEPLPRPVARAISRHCSAGAVESAVPHRYAFVRTFMPGTPVNGFDEDERLQVAIGLSRLIRPTSVGLEESAQVMNSLTDPERMVVTPGPITGPASEAYVADRSRADWLTVADATLLRTLIDRYHTVDVPGRVRRALWHHEFAARALDMAARWTSVVTGLEALFNTDSEFVSRQLRTRCAAVAAELEIRLTIQDAGRAYSLRSSLSHGSVTRVDPETLQLYISIERVLRDTLRRSILEEQWRQRFVSDDTVRAAWPVERPNTCPTCQQRLPPAR